MPDGVSVKIRRKACADWLAADAACARRIRELGEGGSDWQNGQQQRSHRPASWRAQAWRRAPRGLIRCQRCGRKLTLKYTGAKHGIPRYSCSRAWMDNGPPHCIAFAGLRVDDAIENALLTVVGPGAIAAAIAAEKEAGQSGLGAVRRRLAVCTEK